MNKNAYKGSGLANSKAVSVVEKDGKASLTLKTRSQNKPGKATKTVGLRKGQVKGNAAIKKHLSGNFYRRDLERAALARFTALAKAKSGRKAINKKTRRGRK